MFYDVLYHRSYKGINQPSLLHHPVGQNQLHALPTGGLYKSSQR